MELVIRVKLRVFRCQQSTARVILFIKLHEPTYNLDFVKEPNLVHVQLTSILVMTN